MFLHSFTCLNIHISFTKQIYIFSLIHYEINWILIGAVMLLSHILNTDELGIICTDINIIFKCIDWNINYKLIIITVIDFLLIEFEYNDVIQNHMDNTRCWVSKWGNSIRKTWLIKWKSKKISTINDTYTILSLKSWNPTYKYIDDVIG